MQCDSFVNERLLTFNLLFSKRICLSSLICFTPTRIKWLMQDNFGKFSHDVKSQITIKGQFECTERFGWRKSFLNIKTFSVISLNLFKYVYAIYVVHIYAFYV